LEVKGMKNLNCSLAGYFNPEILKGENMYYCDSCNKKVEAEKTYQIKEYPKNLIFVLKRFEYVRTSKKKINERFEFPID
jgi:ubiquitin carboxyl-terminal hydrolase 48